ncbi:MAG: sensor histidine kinase [Bryobacterales bacterium]|nr:sensor histidine kinase [Bryobacterales bacterium]
MAVSAVMERIGKLIPNPDPAIQKRMERTQPLRAELIGTIRVVWAVVLAGLVAFRFWMGIHFLDFFLGVAFPAFWLLGTWSKNKPFAGAALLVSVVFGTMFFTPIPQSEGLVILTILLAGLAVGEFFVGIWTFVCAVAFPFALSDSRAWQVNAGWSAVYVAAGWLVILFSRHLEQLLERNLVAEEQQRGAIVEERTRFAREIHDTLAQGFTGILMQLNAAEQRLPPDSEAGEYINKARELARASLDQARRSVSALPMGVLANSTLLEAIGQIGQETIGESNVKFETRLEGAPYPLSEPREANLLRISQEAITNAVRHSGADRISVRLAYQPGAVALEIEDNGRGMSDLAGSGFGVDGMRERIRQIGGQIDIRSQADRGTRILVIVSNA